ncbi:MAG: DUF1674 domain-containing protein [Alphaproteobacteria bacterium]
MTDAKKDQAFVTPPSERPPAGPLAAQAAPQPAGESAPKPAAAARKPEIGGPKGPEPTRYGDWEKSGRCVDF